jgi:hypothetical protein
MRKKVTTWDYHGKILSNHEKEKALGGHNGNLMFEEIKKATVALAKKRTEKNAVRQELLNNGIDWEELGV